MEKSYLIFLKDYDIICLLNERIPKLIKQRNIDYHIQRNKCKNIHYQEIIQTFKKLTEKRDNSKYVSFIQPIFPFYYGSTVFVNHAIKIYEKKCKCVVRDSNPGHQLGRLIC